MGRLFTTISASEFIQAYWWQRFSEENGNPSSLVLAGLTTCRRTPVDDDLIEFFNIRHEPVFDDKGCLIAQWVNRGNVSRPKNGRFFERWNNNTKHFDTWIYQKI
jgi:hypothetical protein